MSTNTDTDISKAFEHYKSIIWNVDNDLNFWRSFLKLSIKNYQNQKVKPDEIYSAAFAAYDIQLNSNGGTLKAHKDTISIKTVNLEQHSAFFFSWIMNLSILKSYNALEELILQAIGLKFFPELENQTSVKKYYDSIHLKVKEYLKSKSLKVETKNNRHLIMFLQSNSDNVDKFLHQTVRIDLSTLWIDYFELLSILRNMIAHQGTKLSSDTLNQIKSKSGDVFDRHFSVVPNEFGQFHIEPKEGSISALISLTNDFGVNVLKFMWAQKDLKFLKLFSIG